MESFDDDDDTHYCNKCHRTINGLENYVRHRQSGCRTIGDDKPVSVYHSPVSTPNVSYPEILNADAFFSSLELQSSAKPQPRRSTDLLDTRLRRSGRNEERKRKRMRKDKSPEEKDESKPNLMPVVTDLDDLGIPSLVGFPEIVSSSKQTSSSTSKHVGTSGGGGGTVKVERGATDQKQHDWLDDTILTDLTEENKEELHNLDRYDAEYEYAQQDDESDDESCLDVDMQAEEESYSESDDPEHDQEYPPQGHTGGKWRPEGISSQEEAAQQQQDDAEADEPAHPPPSHTGGKWKPNYVQVCTCFEKPLILLLSPEKNITITKYSQSTNTRAANTRSSNSSRSSSSSHSSHHRVTRAANGFRELLGPISARDIGAVPAVGNWPPGWFTTGTCCPICTPEEACRKSTEP